MRFSDPVSPQLCRAFRAQPLPDAAYRSRNYRRVLQQLEQAVEKRVGSVLLTGPPGSGKTMAIRAFVESQDRVPDRLVMFAQSDADADQRAGRLDLLSAMLRKIPDSPARQILVMVDDAQSLTAGEQQLLLRVEATARRGGNEVTAVLVGDTEAADTIRSWRQFSGDGPDDPVITLSPLGRDEVAAYLRHRLAQAGLLGAQSPLPFDAEATELLFELSLGVPRILDHFADRALYEAAQEGRSLVDAELLRGSFLDISQLDLAWPAPLTDKTRAGGNAAAMQPPVPAPARSGLRLGPAYHPSQSGADPLQTVVDRRPASGRRRLPLYATLTLGIAGTAMVILWQSPAFRTGEQGPTLTALPAAAPAAAPVPAPVAAEPRPATAPVAETPAAPRLPAVAGVSPDPAPAQLMAAGAQLESDRPSEAALAYEGAALWGDARAAYFLGQLFETGSGVPHDLMLAQAWYSVAVGITGAERRLEALAALPPPQGGKTATPVPFHHALFRSGRTMLHWRTTAGQSPQRYVVEYVAAGGDHRLSQAQTTLSAMLLDRPLIRWRVVSLDDQGRDAGVSAWSRPLPPPR